MAILKKTYFAYIIIFFSAVVFLLILVGFGRHGLLKFYEIQKEKEKYLAIIRDLKENNRLLSAEIRRLREDQKYFESVVRKELGLVKDNEIIYHFKKNFKGYEDNNDNKKKQEVDNGPIE